MFADYMEDLEIKLAVEKECRLRRDAENDPCADRSLYVPWGIMGPMDYDDNATRSKKPN